MRPQFPVYSECTFKCEIPDKPGEPKDCAKSCELVKAQREKIELYERTLRKVGFTKFDPEKKSMALVYCQHEARIALKAGNQ